MKPHIHAEIIKAWADGAEIEARYCIISLATNRWSNWFTVENPEWIPHQEYRVKQQPKPDIVRYIWATKNFGSEHPISQHLKGVKPNTKLTFDGETGELKSAEVL